jgi:nitrogen-specific signal transduction histidine kinase
MPFVEGESVRDRLNRERATGLGLHLARRVVQFHKGDVDFTSEPGRTVCRVRLPASGAGAPRADR